MKFLIFLIILAAVIVLLRMRKQTKKTKAPTLPNGQMHALLNAHVHFYSALQPAAQEIFRARVQQFLDQVKITPVGEVALTALDRLYVAASAIIPISHFPDWAYNNLNEVLIYPDAFTKDFTGDDEDKNVLGMVGEGAMNRMMILSIQSLRNGFESNSPSNTGIHEFVHLLDKADGATDGIPEVMLTEEMLGPWLKYVQRAIRNIRTKQTDIDPYAGTNEAEFFAVISEYFFQKPEQLQVHHPQLFSMLEQIYHPAGAGTSSN